MLAFFGEVFALIGSGLLVAAIVALAYGDDCGKVFAAMLAASWLVAVVCTVRKTRQ